jgi:transposase-like protein
MKHPPAFWAEHVAAASHADISAAAYARLHGIAVKSLYYWKRKLRAEVAPVATAKPVGGKFVAVRMAEPVVAPPSSGCTLIMASGLRLEIPALPAPEWLAAVSRATQGVC